MQPVRPEDAAERFAARVMVVLGYRDAQVTQRGADGGIDVSSTRAVAQVKNWAKPVGRPQLQNLVGAAAKKRSLELWFFALNGYSRQAIEYAGEHGIILIIYTSSGDVGGANQAGRSKALAYRAALPRAQDDLHLIPGAQSAALAAEWNRQYLARDKSRPYPSDVPEVLKEALPRPYPVRALYVEPAPSESLASVPRPATPRLPPASPSPQPNPPPHDVPGPYQSDARQQEPRPSRLSAIRFLVTAVILVMIAIIALPSTFASLFCFSLAAVAAFIGIVSLASS